MTHNRSRQIATILREIGTHKCLKKAEALEQESSPNGFLNLRNLDLDASNVKAIARCLNQEQEPLQSISFSYNVRLGDLGATALSNHLPKHTGEIGLVNCGIGDVGGMEILNWMKNAPQLQMICMEQNNFSALLKSEFRKFSNNNPQILVVI